MAFALFKPTELHRPQYYYTDLQLVDYETQQTSSHKVTIPAREPEEDLRSVQFNIFKFNNRPRPNQKRTLIIGCFSEFGCETIGCLYCIPRIVQRYPGYYLIAMGWYGREYLYRHLVDEFWEIKEEYMWLRDYTRAFHHLSVNLKKIEDQAAQFGQVIPSAGLGWPVICNYCRMCGKLWQEWRKYAETCPACQSTVIVRSLLSAPNEHKANVTPIPPPSLEMREWAKTLLKPKSVGIFARGRKTYGRNLPPDFYVKLIELLESKGYNIVWLGEKQSTQPCPVDHVFDFSRMPESRDLERTLAIVSNLCFTVQFWTASTRIASMVGTPFLLFESPEQVYCTAKKPGQEGQRIALASFAPKKICVSHYERSCANQDKTLELVRRCVEEMECGNFSDVIGQVEDPSAVAFLRQEHNTNLKLEVT